MARNSARTKPGIMQNGNRAVDFDNFNMNQMSFDAYFYRLMDLAISVFEWKNLPKGVDARMLEYWLLLNGFCVFFFDEDLKGGINSANAPEGYAVLQAMISGNWDMYNYPRERTAFSVNGLNIPLNESNSVIVFNNYLRTPIWSNLILYAKRLAEIDRTIDVNVRAQKCPKVVRCTDAQRLTFKNMMMQVEGNDYYIFADKNIDVNDIEVLDTSAPYVADQLMILKHRYWNEALTFLGVENVTTEKKERMVSDEVLSNMGDVEAQRFTRLNARKKACADINELFGLDVNCDFRSGIYIKADGYGSQEIPTGGMEESSMDYGGEQVG